MDLCFPDDTFTWDAPELVASVDASDLGFKPGFFPDTFDVQSTTTADRYTFHQWMPLHEDGEFTMMEYRALNKRKQLVYIFVAND